MGNTVIAVYEADGDAEKAFQRLNAIYNSNYINDAVYGAVIDLSPSVCYISASDEKTVKTAKRYFEETVRDKKERFFCALRPRRYLSDPNKLKKYRNVYARFACENGALGAIDALIGSIKSGKECFYAYFGTEIFSDCDRLYFSGYDENGDKGVLPYPDTIKRLCERYKDKEALFPKITIGRRSFFNVSEGLYPFERYNKRKNICDACVGKSEESNRVVTCDNENAVRRFNDIAFRGICDICVRNEIESVSDAALMMCAVAAFREQKRLGDFETLEMSENIFVKLRSVFFSGYGNENEGESAFLLTLLFGVYSKLSCGYPEFHFLKNDVKDMAAILLSHIKNDNGYGFLCSKEYCDPCGTDQMSFMAKTVVWGTDREELKSFLNMRGEELFEDIRAMASVAVYAVQNAFRECLSKVPELEYKIRYLRSNRKNISFAECEKVYHAPFLFGAEALKYESGFYPVRARFAKNGCDISLLPFAAYIEVCRERQKRYQNKRYALTLFSDTAYPLAYLILRASAIDPDAEICVVTKDKYSHGALKKASSGRARLLTHYECSVKEMRRLSAVVRQITPYTVLGDLLSELNE